MAQDLSRSIAGFPAAGLRPITRYITSHNEKGLGIFKYTDSGDHIKVICDGGAVSNHIYSTGDNPVDLADEKDIAYAARHEPPLHIHNGCVVRLIDFAPGMVSPMHRAMSIDFGIVVEGELEITLDSGESRVLRPGDMTVQRATIHKWRNISPTKPGRMLFILLDCKPLKVGEEFVEQFLGSLDKDYVTTEEYEKAQAAATKS